MKWEGRTSARMDTDSPTDALPVWVGLAVAGVALLGVALGLPTGAPDAATPARTVDDVAASSYDAAVTVTFSARSHLELRPNGLERCRGETCAHASFAFGPVTPVADGSPLAAVLRGDPPGRAFDSPTAFAQAAGEARARGSVVAADATRLHARHVTWGGVDVTLVGA